MKLIEAIELLKNDNILVDYKLKEDEEVKYISYNSKDIEANTLFFCKGKNYKEEYLMESIKKGSMAYVSEKKYNIDEENVSYIIVNDIKIAMAKIAAKFYNYAFNDIETIGITGTKGKTTVTYFLKNILDEYTKSKTAVISTVEVITGARHEEAHLTTPEALELHKYFSETANNNVKFLTMEVTSQAYKTSRALDVKFKHGMFLNVSEDHISDAEHPDFNDYLNCKLQLISNVNDMVINADMDEYQIVKSECVKNNVPYITYGLNEISDYRYYDIKREDVGFSFKVENKIKNYIEEFKIIMQGRFNIENAVAAITMAKSLGVDDESIKVGLLNTKVQGRMNVFEKNGLTVIVDYAHNRLSFSKLYESIKLDYPNRRIISLGGGPGNKAYKRRQDFGEIVGTNSDYIYLTAEDPQFETVENICKDIIKYIPENVKYEIVEDRTIAIEKMIKEAKANDVLVLLAKGEEDYQKIKGTFTYFESDLKIVKRILDIEE